MEMKFHYTILLILLQFRIFMRVRYEIRHHIITVEANAYYDNGLLPDTHRKICSLQVKKKNLLLL